MTKPVLDYGRKEPGPSDWRTLGIIALTGLMIGLPAIAFLLWKFRDVEISPGQGLLWASSEREFLAVLSVALVAIWLGLGAFLIACLIRRAVAERQRPGAD